MNTNSNLIPRVELELLLSEYATGMLDKGLKAMVEESLALHPDLQREVDSIRGAFSLVNKAAHNTAIDYETRNLSVHVVHALSRHKKRNPLRHLAWLAPAAAVIAIVVLTVGGPTESAQIAYNRPQVNTRQVTQPTAPALVIDSAKDAIQTSHSAAVEPVHRKSKFHSPALPLTREEMIVDDLVADQIVDRMASGLVDDGYGTVTGITEAEIDVLLAAVVSNESL